jgi:hypothetical protein
MIESNDFGLTLEPGELQTLIEKLCSCGTLRIDHGGRPLGGRPRSRQRCLPRLRSQCRMGERSVGGGCVEFWFG